MIPKRHHIEDLAGLPEEQAVEIHLGELCWARLLLWQRLGVLAHFGWLMAVFESPPLSWRHALPLLSAGLSLVYFLWRRRGLEALPFLRYGYFFLLGHLILVRLAYLPLDGPFHPFDFMLPFLLLLFPLPFGHALTYFGVFWVPMVLVGGLADFLSGSAANLGATIGYSAFLLLTFSINRWAFRRRIKSFLAAWQRARAFALEGQRMRSELDQARRIQLSMLPQHDPYSSWLDIAGVSRPANEVGGDYYGFFEVDEDRQAVVVADVAGHGVASGLLLAGVRGCLVMLHEDGAGEHLAAPRELLARLNRVVRTVGGRRTFVTMAYALFERAPPRLTLAAAAHPPLLRWRAAGEVGEIEEIALPSLPLGTTLASDFPQRRLDIEPGDVFLFVTDGIAEALDPSGRLYGESRLHAALAACALGATAAEIRDTLLAELEQFLGAQEGQDDVTLVVVRVKQ